MHSYSQRPRIVLLAAEGKMNKNISTELNIRPNTVGQWRRRFAEGGVTAIMKDAPRSGCKPRTDMVRLIVEKTIQEKPRNATHWSGRTLAAALGIDNQWSGGCEEIVW